MNNGAPSAGRAAYLARLRREKRSVRVWQVALVAALFLWWELSTRIALADGFLLSSPSRMGRTFAALCGGGELAVHIGTSCLETVVGFLAGTLLGTAVAVGMWWSEKLARILDPYLVVLNALPKTALGPIFIVWMGAGMGAIVVMALAISLIVTILSMYQGYLSAAHAHPRCQPPPDSLDAGVPGQLAHALQYAEGQRWAVVGWGHHGGVSCLAGRSGLSHRLWLSGVQHGSGDDQRADSGAGGGGDVPAGAAGGKNLESLLGGYPMKKVAALVLALGMLAALCACGGESDKKTILRLNEVTHSVFYAPQYVAMSQGFFADEGLEIELTNGGGADKVMSAVISGQSDIGLAGPEACIYVYNQGKDDYPRIFAQLTKRDGSFLMGRTDESFSWENLRGKTVIGGRAGGVPEMTLEYVLRRNGLVPQEDTVVDTSVQFNMMAGAFSGGSGDYVTLFEPTATEMELAGKGYILCSIGAESGEIPYTAYFASQSYMAAHPDVVQGFTNAIARAQKWILSHSDREVAEAIAAQFPDTSLDVLERVTARHRAIDAWNQTPVMEQAALERLETVMETAGELTRAQWVDFEKLVDNSFARSAQG